LPTPPKRRPKNGNMQNGAGTAAAGIGIVLTE